MKLEDLLAMHLMEWPSNTRWVAQGPDGKIYNNRGSLILLSTFDDCIDAYAVTQGEYLAARDRLHAATVKDMKAQPTPKPAEWLEIAKDQFRILTKDKDCRDLSHEQRAEFAFDAADAFYAEMNKRIAS